MKLIIKWFKSLFEKKNEPLGYNKQLFNNEPEFIEHRTYSYKTELQIVQRDNQVICTDYNSNEVQWNHFGKLNDDFYISYNPVESYIKKAYNNKVIHTFDKSNKHFTEISMVEVKKILYKPCTITIESKEVRNPNYVKTNN